MKKIRDERLFLNNLQNIKITYILQTIGIICILGYSFFQGGLEEMRANPLWLLFIVTSAVFAYLSMSVNVENEKTVENPKKSFSIGMVILSVIVILVAYLTSITPNYGWREGVLLGVILFICGLIPLTYIYRLRVKEQADFEDA